MNKRNNMKKGIIQNFIYKDADICQTRTRQYYKCGEIKRLIREQKQKELRESGR